MQDWWCTRPPYSTSLCAHAPRIPHVSVQLVLVVLHLWNPFTHWVSTLIPLDPSNPLVGDMSQERWMVSIVMWIPQSLDGVFHGKSIYKILQMDNDWGHPYFRKPPFGPKNRRFGSWKVKIQDKLWSVPCLSMGWSELFRSWLCSHPNHTDNVCWNLSGYYCIVFYSIVWCCFMLFGLWSFSRLIRWCFGQTIAGWWWMYHYDTGSALGSLGRVTWLG